MKLTPDDKKAPVIKSDLLQVVEIVAKDKGFEKREILNILEEALLPCIQSRYGNDKKISITIDKTTGAISIKRVRTVVDNVIDHNNEISLNNAKRINPDTKVGDDLFEDLPPIELTRSMIQSARQVIGQKIKDIERRYQHREFSNRIGDIIVGTVNRVDFSNVVLDIGRSEGIIRRSELIPNEVFKIGERVKVLLCGLNEEPNVPLLQLSRTHPDFLKKLFAQEVPEVYDGIVSVVAVSRDPGSKAKVAVTASDPTIDPVGACVGPKGIRVRAVSDELKGEKIDVIKWSDDPATFIVNSLSPARPEKIIIDDISRSVDAIVPEDQLSLAIGRRGQNVRLAAQLTGWKINAITAKTAMENKVNEQQSVIEKFKTALDVDFGVAQCLADDGYTSVSEIAEATIDDLTGIDGFDEDLAKEINNRAVCYIDERVDKLSKLCKEKKVDEKLINNELIRPELLELLINADIKTLNDVGGLSTDELLEISKELLTKTEAEDIIMKIRKSWF